MMLSSRRGFTLALGLLTVCGLGTARAAGNDRSPDRSVSFGALRAASEEVALKQASDWLKQAGKTDVASTKAFQSIWSNPDRPLLNRIAETLSLGDADAAKLLADANDPTKPAPQTVPAILKDTKRPAFFRANLALAYAKALSNRRIFEESLDTLSSVKPEEVVDPGAYLFHRAVAEHALLRKDEATRSIIRLLDDAVDVPERYKMVAVLMAFDMQSWKEKDLGEIARKMDNIERRLELSRGGPKTQKIQKEVVARLDEIIKQLENECKGECNGGCCPNGGKPGAGKPNSPMRDSMIGRQSGPGNVDPKQMEAIARGWGKLPEKERAQAMQELTRDMPPRYREVIENYFRKLAQQTSEASR